MKKTLLVSFLTGITFAGAAFAVPTPEDRQKLCEKDPFKYVWVKKTQACVPVDPCASLNDKIQEAYCIKAGGVANSATAKEIITRYMKNVMKVDIKSVKLLATSTYGVYTSDDGYYAVIFGGYDYGDEVKSQLNAACWAYGKKNYFYTDNGDNRYGCLDVKSQKECDNIADFASLLFGNVVEGEVEQLGQSICWLDNPDGWREYIRNNSYNAVSASAPADK